MMRTRRWLIVGLAVVGIAANLPALYASFVILGYWIRLRTLGEQYFHYNYMGMGILWFALSVFGLIAAGSAIKSKRSSGLLPALSVIMGLACVLIIPASKPEEAMILETGEVQLHADAALMHWAEIHGNFPRSEEELWDALSDRLSREPSLYLRNGQPVGYSVQFVGNATGPSLESSPPRPGMLVYAVNSEHTEYWLVATTLRAPVSKDVIFVHTPSRYEQEKPWVVNRKC